MSFSTGDSSNNFKPMKVQFIILKWLALWFYPNTVQSSEAIKEMFDKLSVWSATKGDLWVILHLKEIRLLYTRHLCGDPIYQSNHIIGIRKDGLPKGFPILNNIFIKKDRESVSFVLTLLSVSRTIKAWKDPSVKTITEPYKGDVLDFEIYRKDILKILTYYKVGPVLLDWTKSNLHYSIKAGPVGLSTWSAVIDATLLNKDQIENLKILSKDLYLYILNWRLLNLPDIIGAFFKPGKELKEVTRKLSIVKDPEGKSRIIAIFDYYTQTILRLYHLECFKILRKFPADRTFTQNPIVGFEGPYYSYDLSAATDRFPLGFQKVVTSILLGCPVKARAWASLLSDTEFLCPWDQTYVKYVVGQPMGAYSSWAVFAISHHIIVQLCALRLNQFPTNNYILLGDDIVIGGDKLAAAYRDMMSHFGVDISEHKSHVSKDTYEFAKRWYHRRIEYSGIQVSAFMETWTNYTLLYNTIRQYLDRGFIPYRFTSIAEMVYALLLSFGVYHRKAMNIYRKVEVLNAFYRWIHKGDQTLIRSILVNSYPNEAPIPFNEYHLEIFLRIRFDYAYQKMYIKLQNDIEQYLSHMETKLIDHFSIWWPNSEDDYQDCKVDYLGPGDIVNLPISLALTKVFTDLSQNPILTDPGQDIKESIRVLCIPSPSSIGGIRSDDMVKLVTSVIASKLLEVHRTTFKDGSMTSVINEARWLSEHEDVS
jgi:hypothetical protein